MPGFMGLTGTPGTGKKSIAPFLASKLELKSLGMNDFANSSGLVSASAEAPEVDARLLGKRILRHMKGPALIFGHLLPYAFPRGTFRRVVVLRCDPKILKSRLLQRNYPPEKVLSNVEAELIGVIASDCFKAFGVKAVVEFDTSAASPKGVSKAILPLLRVGSHGRQYDWTRGYDSARKLRSLLSIPGLGAARI